MFCKVVLNMLPKGDELPVLQGVLLGLSNTAGVLAGVFGTAATGYILQHGLP
jgi:MFS transporter, ACS family, solute carrier family 17 (sodium-dependent inorganic phosphate cotransporter), other